MIGTIFSLLLITNYFNLKVNSFNNNNNKAKFLIDILQIESANALSSKGVDGLEKVRNDALQNLEAGDNKDLKNTTLQTTPASQEIILDKNKTNSNINELLKSFKVNA